MDAETTVHELRRAAAADPNIVGLFLGGSRGKGFPNRFSDYDVYLIVRDEAAADYRRRYPRHFAAGVDVMLYGWDEFAAHASYGGPDDWNRYTFANLRVEIDKTGDLQTLVDSKGRLPDEAREPLIRAALDAYINSAYRGAKALRDGNLLGSRLHASASLGALLALIFALDGRHAPFYDYLERELRAYPLATFPLDSETLLAALELVAAMGDFAVQQRLLTIVERVCRTAGQGAVIDAWGGAFGWLLEYRPGQ